MNEQSYQTFIESGLGQLPLTDRALFTLKGEDRVRYLNGQITNDVTRLRTGHALYAAVLTGKGKMISDLFVAASEETLWIDVPLALRSKVRERLEKFLIADDAELEDVTETYSLSHQFSPMPQTPGGFRNPRFGLPGSDCWAKREEPLRIDSFPTIEPALAEILRVELGWGQWGAELDDNTLPQEAHLELRGLSYEKGCYVGQETVARIRSIGHVNRHLASLELVDGVAAVPPVPLMSEGVEAGKLTSVVFSPLRQKFIGLGMVGRKFNQIGHLCTTGESQWRIIEPPRQSAVC